MEEFLKFVRFKKECMKVEGGHGPPSGARVCMPIWGVLGYRDSGNQKTVNSVLKIYLFAYN